MRPYYILYNAAAKPNIVSVVDAILLQKKKKRNSKRLHLTHRKSFSSKHI